MPDSPPLAATCAKRPRRFILFTLLACLCAFPLFAKQTKLTDTGDALRVDEAATRVRFGDGFAVKLAVANTLGRKLDARIKIELVDPRDRVRASAEREATLGAGESLQEIALSPAGVADSSELLWYRLRYEVVPVVSPRDAGQGATEKAPAPAVGIISVSAVTPDAFDLQVTTSEFARRGSRLHARTRAVHPVTSRPLAGVRVAGRIELDDDERHAPREARGATDTEGYALLSFEIPADAAGDDLDLKVTGERAGFRQEASAEIQLPTAATIIISTDKPLYQPGQLLRVRTLVLDTDRRALRRTPVKLTIENPDGTVYRTDLTTSRFGIAHTEWQIPETARLGDYRINVEITDGLYEENSDTTETVKVSRYELPNFAVAVKPDKPYYLPTDTTADVEVRADYLFGQPVRSGRVRVVRETEREWDYRKQRWETKEAAEYEGEIDGEGKFVARIDLRGEHAELEERDYARFASTLR